MLRGGWHYRDRACGKRSHAVYLADADSDMDKVMQIYRVYRSQAVDANGNTTSCEMHYDGSARLVSPATNIPR
jgi:hypothetical protein